MKVLITGGAGFIGSTLASACLDEGIEPIILDDLSTGRPEFVAGRVFYQGDIADGDLIDRVFRDHPDIHATVGCAAKIIVPESVADPLGYYDTNVIKGLALIGHLLRNNCTRFVFSGSAAIYDSGENITEDAPLRPMSPYARTKASFEGALEDITGGTPLRVITLRYFNPIGADPKQRTGLQTTRPTHALGVMIDRYRADEAYPVTGTNWPTRDGSGIRDYVHVWDLAAAHIDAVRVFDDVVSETSPRYLPINLGSGTGSTVFELIEAFEEVTGRPLDRVLTDARPGDVAGAYPCIDRARDLLGWKPVRTLQDGIRDALAWNANRTTVLKEE